jgi:hypothetical protein
MKLGAISVRRECALLCVALLALFGCSGAVPPGSLVVTELPRSPAPFHAATDALDLRYPPGSRVVLLGAPLHPKRLRVLSQGLAAAGSPRVSYDGQHVFFTGKAAPAGDWQIYEVRVEGGRPHVLTSMPGGASDPALLPDGSLVFASPVSKLGATNRNPHPPALYRQSPGGKPRQLTFGPTAITDPTVLSDGRILFVSAQPSASSNSASGLALYTINNDGTEITAFAGQHDHPTGIERPRQLADGRIGFLVSRLDSARPGGSAEFVRLARPFQSRAPLLPNVTARVRSVEPASNGDLWVCAESPSGASVASPSFAVFRTGSTPRTLGAPLLSDPAWEMVEAVEVAPHRPPMGRLSNVDLSKQIGRILCLDANDTAGRSPSGDNAPTATQVRVLAAPTPGQVRVVGDVPVQADGSFRADVPADVPLGFEALDAQGQVLRRVAPWIWVRPGENRSCVGCHEPHNRSPHNFRPLALRTPAPPLRLDDATLARTKR